MTDGHRGPALEPLPGKWRQLARQRRLPGREDLGDRMADRLDEVAGQLRVATDERTVLVGSRVVCPHDQALEVVEVRVEAAFARPGDDFAGDRRRHRRVDEQATEPVRTGRRHFADQRALVADDRRIELEHAREMHRARDHPAGHQAHDHATGTRRANGRPGVRPDLEVVADERPVDVERDQLDGQDGFGCLDPGHVLMMPDGGFRRFQRPVAARSV